MGYECSAMLYVKGSQSFARSPSSRWLDVLTVSKLKLINFEEKQWYAAKLEAITDRRDRIGKLDGYKLNNANSMITLQNYIERKNINVNN